MVESKVVVPKSLDLDVIIRLDLPNSVEVELDCKTDTLLPKSLIAASWILSVVGPNAVFAKIINSLHEPAPHLVFRMFAVLVKSLTRDITPTSTVDWSSVKFASYDAAQAEVGHLPECSCLNDFADAMQDAIALSLQRL